MINFRQALYLFFALLLVGCTDSPSERYDVEITRTEFGIPHVQADDYASLGYGIGYSYAEDNYCMFLEKMVQINGEYSRYFGPDEPVQVGSLGTIPAKESDFYFRSQFDKEQIANAFYQGPEEVVELTRGYADGINRYYRELGPDQLPDACRNAEWLRPVTEEDLYLWYNQIARLVSGSVMSGPVANAQPPELTGSESAKKHEKMDRDEFDTPSGNGSTGIAGSTGNNISRDNGDTEGISSTSGIGDNGGIGSNAWAFGKESTDNNSGLLFGNPHWMWGNIHQFYQAHLNIPGELNVMGVTYGGIPVIIIGFNRSMAWSHTVSTGARYVVRELELSPGSPTTYIVDGEEFEMQVDSVTIEWKDENGDLARETRAFYTTGFGPVVERSGMEWTTDTAFALTDMNRNNYRVMEQWLRIGKAENVDEVYESLRSVMGIPWVNTLAADEEGQSLYADYSIKAYVTDEMFENCINSEIARQFTDGGIVTLDGSTHECTPRTDPDSPQQGVLPASLLPDLKRADYTANSNNSYWLTNVNEPITGLPSVNGGEESSMSLRAQSGLRVIDERLAGRDGLPGDRMNREMIKALVFGHPEYPGYGNHNRAAELMLDAVEQLCQSGNMVSLSANETVDIGEACTVLSGWDGRHHQNAQGAHLFREFWAHTSQIENLWSAPFNPDEPLRTPAEPNLSDAEVKTSLQQALAGAILKLRELDIAIDQPWGELHYHSVGEEQIPVSGNRQNTLNLMVTPDIREEGYTPVIHGASYVQIVGFDEGRPVADAVLLYGQSANPDSPHYYDQFKTLWAQDQWHRLPFTPEEIEASAIRAVQLRE